MKRLKEIDVRVQVALIAGSLVFSFVTQDHRFIYCYLLVGGWQLLSCLVHALSPSAYLPAPGRRRYLLALAWTLGIGVFSLAGLTIFFFFALLFISPLFAIWYIVICAEETRVLKKRALIQFR